MNYLKINKDNIDREHICCAMSGKQSLVKKEWMKQRFDEGLVFYRSEERGKCFIEYIPAENAWVPIDADGYIYINCLWIAGALKGHGYSEALLSECIRDAERQNKQGLCILSAEGRKKEFLSDPKYLAHKGFVLYFTDQCPFTCYWVPRVREAAKAHDIPLKVIHVTDREEAQNVPAPVTTYALFRDGKFVTHAIQSDKKFLALAGVQE